MVVPEGYRVDAHRAKPVPGVVRSAGGVWLAHLGGSNDEPAATLDRILGEVERLIAGPRSPISFVQRSDVASLMKPELPVLETISGMLVWTLDAAALVRAPGAPALVQRLLAALHAASRAALTQCVFVLNGDAPPAAALVGLFHELGLGVRTPAPQDRAVLAEVHRPDGVIISGLLGAPVSPASSRGAWARDVNLEKDGATGDRERLARLEDSERRELSARLAPAGGAQTSRVVDVATRLRRSLVAVLDAGDAAKPALYAELGTRDVPLLFIVDPKTRAPGVMSWPDGFRALPVYADKLSLLAATRDLQLAPGSFGVTEVMPSALFTWAASSGSAAAIGVSDESNALRYVRIEPNEVRSLAAGQAGAARSPGG